jgi:hypothetical protein
VGGRKFPLATSLQFISNTPPSKDLSQSSACCLLHAGFLTGLLFDAEDGSDISPETCVEIKGTIPEDVTLHNHCCENLKYRKYDKFVAYIHYVHVAYTVSLSSAVVTFMSSAYLEELLHI